jgi:hypothetical protein
LAKRHGLSVEVDRKPLLRVYASATAFDLAAIDAALDWPTEYRRVVEEGSARCDDPDQGGGE